jgi:hypothetical protein
MVALEPDAITLLGDTVYLDGEPCNAATQNCRSMYNEVCDVVDCNTAKDISCFNYCWADTTWYKDPIKEYNYLLNDSQFTLNKVYANKSTWPVPILAIWDDHDYCKDNSNETCRYKNLTRDAYVDFMKVVDQKNILSNVVADLAKNTHVGIYYHIDYNKTLENNQTLKLRFYMMDVRWYRTEDDIFGSDQRLWFENLLSNSNINKNINYHIVCSGTTYYPTFGLGQSLAETWPTETKDWFQNVTRAAGIRDRLIMLSGDVHYSAIYKDNRTIEVVTSAMTHGIYDIQAEYLQLVQESDGYLVTDVIDIENIGIIDIGLDYFSVTYLNQSGLPIANFSYNYTNNTVYYHVIQKNLHTKQISHWWYSTGMWIVIGVVLGFCLIYSVVIGIYCYRKKH